MRAQFAHFPQKSGSPGGGVRQLIARAIIVKGGGRTLLMVAARDADGHPSGRLVVAIDVLDARAGDEVTVALGSGARNVLRPGPENRDLLCDAAVAAIVEGEG